MNQVYDTAAKRKLRTRKTIKEAMLKLLRKKDFIDISVTDICHTAGISRGTFYSHYKNTHLVIDELFSDALIHIGNVPIQHIYHPGSCGNCDGALCRFLRDNKKYQPLFLSDTLYSQAVKLVVNSLAEDFLNNMKKQADLHDDMLLNLLYYQISGCMALTRKHIKDSDEKWNQIQEIIDSFLCTGFRSL